MTKHPVPYYQTAAGRRGPLRPYFQTAAGKRGPLRAFFKTKAGKPGVREDIPIGALKAPGPDPLDHITGTHTVRRDGVAVGSVDVQALRHMLRAHGYDVPESGNKVGKVMKSALADFLNPKNLDQKGPLATLLAGTRITGNRNPQDWNKRFGPVGPGGRSIVALNPKQQLDKQGNSKPGNAEQRTPGGNGGKVDLSGIQSIAQEAGVPIPTALAARLAQAEAGSQFDPQIHDVQTLLAHAPVDSSQHQQDIKNWYGQVVNALSTAGARDKAASSAGIGSMRDALSAIASSLGGSANRGSSDVAAAGLNDIGTLGALGTSEAMLNNDLAPVVTQERAAAAKNQLNTDALAKAQLEQQLEDLQGQRGQTAASTKASTLMQILGANNDLAQQQFQDRMSVQQAGEAAQLNGLKAMYYASRSGQPAHGSFGYATPNEMQTVQNAVLKHVLDANGNPLPGMTQAKATAIARTVGSSFFPGGGMPQGWAQSVISPFFG